MHDPSPICISVGKHFLAQQSTATSEKNFRSINWGNRRGFPISISPASRPVTRCNPTNWFLTWRYRNNYDVNRYWMATYFCYDSSLWTEGWTINIIYKKWIGNWSLSWICQQVACFPQITSYRLCVKMICDKKSRNWIVACKTNICANKCQSGHLQPSVPVNQRPSKPVGGMDGHSIA